jgi:hypothetical protein
MFGNTVSLSRVPLDSGAPSWSRAYGLAHTNDGSEIYVAGTDYEQDRVLVASSTRGEHGTVLACSDEIARQALGDVEGVVTGAAGTFVAYYVESRTGVTDDGETIIARVAD